MTVFGFDELVKKLENMANKTKGASIIVRSSAEDIKKEAVRIAESKGLKKTGAGVGGITVDPAIYQADIGWAGRPGMHLYFHEKGFHAGFAKSTGRASRGKRKRKYKRGSRVYKAPQPHIRPATLKYQDKFIKKIKDYILED